MKKIFKVWIYSLIFTLFVVGMAKGISTYYEHKYNSGDPTIIVTAEVLSLDFGRNLENANTSYLNKTIEVTGTVGEDGFNILENSLLLDTFIYDIKCEFTADNIMNVSLLLPGDEVTINGVVVGLSLPYIIVESCTLLEVH